MCSYEDRLRKQTYEDDEPVSVGWERKRDDVEWIGHVPETLFLRAQSIANGYSLHQIPNIDHYGPTRINKKQCETICKEVDFLITVVNDDLLAEQLRIIRRAAEQCMRSPFATEVLFVGP